MGGGSKSQTVGFKYFFDIHMGICRGPIDEIVQITAGDRDLRRRPIKYNGSNIYQHEIDRGDIFGGKKKEGGIAGTLTTMMGRPDQIPPDYVQAALRGDPNPDADEIDPDDPPEEVDVPVSNRDLVPGFRGVVTLFFSGLVAANNPYPKAWKFRVRRIFAGWYKDKCWYPERAQIQLGELDDRTGVLATNAAHIIYECSTNPSWGRGLDPAIIDDASFRKAADKLYAEKLGVCIAWKRSNELGSFIQDVVDLVGGVVSIDRTSGLMTFKLIRDDYDASTLPRYDYLSGLLEVSFQKATTTDSAPNEIIVNYVDPLKRGATRQARVQNLAARHSVGSAISKVVDYLGAPTQGIATRLAQRDLRVHSSGVKRLDVVLDRRGWKTQPGDVIVVHDPEKGVNNVILRVGTVKLGQLVVGKVLVSGVEDVFGLADASFTGKQETGWEEPSFDPVPITRRVVTEPSYRDLIRSERSLPVGSAGVVTLASRPNRLSVDFDVSSRAGTDAFDTSTSGAFCPTGVLHEAIDETQTTIRLYSFLSVGLIGPGAALIGEEIVNVTAINTTTGEATIIRGGVDTLPAKHAVNERVWFFDNYLVEIEEEFAEGEEVDVRLLTNTATDILEPELAETVSITLRGRQSRPYPPGDLRVNGRPFFEPIAAGAGALALTWKTRNRVLQKDIIRSYFAADITPEAGTTYEIKLLNGNTLLRTAETAATAFTYTGGMAAVDGANSTLRIEVRAVRDGYRSWNAVTVAAPRVLSPAGALTNAYLALTPSPVSDAERDVIYAMVRDLNDSGVWGRLTYLWWLARVNATGALYSVKTPNAANSTLGLVGTGYQHLPGVGHRPSAGSYRRTGALISAMPGITAANFHLSAYLAFEEAPAAAPIVGGLGAYALSDLYLAPGVPGVAPDPALSFESRDMTLFSTSDAVVRAGGLSTITRVGADRSTRYRGATPIGGRLAASETLPQNQLAIGRVSKSGVSPAFSTEQTVQLLSIGAGLTAEHVSDYNRIVTAAVAQAADLV